MTPRLHIEHYTGDVYGRLNELDGTIDFKGDAQDEAEDIFYEALDSARNLDMLGAVPDRAVDLLLKVRDELYNLAHIERETMDEVFAWYETFDTLLSTIYEETEV